MNDLQKDLGRVLVVGGVLLIVLNAVFTPLMPYEASEQELRSSWPYLVRLSLAVLAAMCYVLGAVGVRMAQNSGARAFDRLAFWVAVTGSSLLIGLEWANVFVLRPLAQAAPDALTPLGEVSLYGIGSAAAASLYALGWILIAVSVWRTRVAPRWVPLTIAAGFVATAALGATAGVWGMIAGSVVIGVGLVGLGLAVSRVEVSP